MGTMGILLIHSDGVVRRELRELLDCYHEFEILGEASSFHDGIAQTASLGPDVIILEGEGPHTGRLPSAAELTISVSRDDKGQPLINVASYKEDNGRPAAHELLVMGRSNRWRVQAVQWGLGGHEVVEAKAAELITAVLLADQTKPTLEITRQKAIRLAEESQKKLLAPNGGTEHPNVPSLTAVARGNYHHDQDMGSNGDAPTEETDQQAIPQAAPGTRYAGDWLGPVTSIPIRAKDTKTNGKAHAVDKMQEHLPHGTTLNTGYSIRWLGQPEETEGMQHTNTDQKPERKPSEDPPEPWLHMWKEPSANGDGDLSSHVQVDLVFPPSVAVSELYRFIIRLRQGTKGEILWMTGSLDEGTCVKAGFDRTVPLLEILRSMPDVRSVKSELVAYNQHDSGQLPPQLPRRIWLDLKAPEEPKQLDFPL